MQNHADRKEPDRQTIQTETQPLEKVKIEQTGKADK